MTLSARRIGKHTTVVFAVMALALIGLAAPAFATVPTITSFSPTTAPAVATCGVTIYGTSFNTPAVSAVDFNGTAASSFTIVSDSQINANLAGAATTGPIHVTNASGTATSSTFTVGGTCVPTITSFSPTSGPPGTAITVTGTYLLNATAADVNGTAAPHVVVSSTQATLIVPIGATTGPLHITTPGGTATSASFTVTAAGLPTITSFTPTSGAVGTSVTITGTNFTGATGVTFNVTAATSFTVNSATQITATVPTGATTGTIKVTTPAGTATSASSFTVAPAPTITSFAPASGPTGSSVTINGTNFSGTGFTTTTVTFNNVTSTFTVVSSTQIKATVPSTATTGPIKITTPGGSVTSATNFTVSKLHSRTVSLALRKHLVARGAVTASDGTAVCEQNVPVKIQRRFSGSWHTVKSTTTGTGGSYSVRIPDVDGKYRAVAPKVVRSGGADVCQLAVSPTRLH